MARVEQVEVSAAPAIDGNAVELLAVGEWQVL
jgi:hypothetical protein